MPKVEKSLKQISHPLILHYVLINFGFKSCGSPNSYSKYPIIEVRLTNYVLNQIAAIF